MDKLAEVLSWSNNGKAQLLEGQRHCPGLLSHKDRVRGNHRERVDGVQSPLRARNHVGGLFMYPEQRLEGQPLIQSQGRRFKKTFPF